MLLLLRRRRLLGGSASCVHHDSGLRVHKRSCSCRWLLLLLPLWLRASASGSIVVCRLVQQRLQQCIHLAANLTAINAADAGCGRCRCRRADSAIRRAWRCCRHLCHNIINRCHCCRRAQGRRRRCRCCKRCRLVGRRCSWRQSAAAGCRLLLLLMLPLLLLGLCSRRLLLLPVGSRRLLLLLLHCYGHCFCLLRHLARRDRMHRLLGRRWHSRRHRCHCGCSPRCCCHCCCWHHSW